jgi:hypothetical protein
VRSKTPASQSSSNVDEEVISTSLIPNPASSISSPAGNLSVADLRLIHHWSTSTFRSIFVVRSPETDNILQNQVPELAFRNDFLMQGILGTASLHMQHLLPDPKALRKRTDIYRARALREFRQALNHIDPNGDSYNAALTMSLLVVILCSQDYVSEDDETTCVRWLSLYAGLRSIVKIKYAVGTAKQQISPLLCRNLTDITVTPVLPTILVNMVRMIDYTDLDYKGLETYCKVLDIIGELYASLSQAGLCDDLYIRAITFCSHPPDEFATYARQKRPRALIILMYYLCFLKLVPGIWWIKGIAQADMSILTSTIDPEWFMYMEIPLRIKDMTDCQEIADLLLK